MGLLREINVVSGAHRLAPVLARSTRIMLSSTAAWLRAEAGQFWGRLGVLVLLVYVLVYLSNRTHWLWWVWGAAWFISCCVMAAHRRDFTKSPTSKTRRTTPRDVDLAMPEEEDAEGVADEEDHSARTAEDQHQSMKKALWQCVEEEVAVAVQGGKKGVRIADLLTSFHSEGSLLDWTANQLKKQLKSVGIPVREQMYFKVNDKKGNQPGVHVDDLTAALGHRPRLPPHRVPDLTRTQPQIPSPAPAVSLTKTTPQ